jgi:HEAT repeats
MRGRNFIVCTSFFVLLLQGGAAFAIGVPNLHLDKLVSSSDLICVANVGELNKAGTAPPVAFHERTIEADMYYATLSVLRTIKGVPQAEVLVNFRVPRSFMGYRRPQPGIRLLFLHQQGEHYVFTDPYYPDLPAVSSLPSTAESSDEVTQVVREVAAVLSSATASTNDKLQVLQIMYALPATVDVRRSLEVGASSARGTELGRMLESELLRIGDISQLRDVANLLSTNSLSGDDKERFLYVIANSVTDRRARPYIEPLLRSGDESVRAAAMEALWHIGSPGSVKSVILGLEDTDRNVRYYAVRALAKIEKEPSWEPSVPEFYEHEQQYVSHWKEWADKNVK